MWRRLTTELAGRPCVVRRVRQITDDDGDRCYGIADLAKHEIYIEDCLHGRELLQYLLHEALHIQRPRASERWVDNTSRELAALIKRAGLLRE